MKNILLIPILLVSLIHCSEKDTSNDPKNLFLRNLIRGLLYSSVINSQLPSNLSVPIPRSIRKSSNISASISKSITRTYDADTAILDGITGLSILQSNTNTISEILQESKRDLILISNIYSKLTASPGVCFNGGTGFVTITSSEISEFKIGLQNLGLSEAEAEIELKSLQDSGVLPSEGQRIPTPAAIYRVSTDTDYDNEVSFSFADNITASQGCPSTTTSTNFQKTIRWNTAKTRIYSSIQKSLKIFGTSITISGSVSYLSESGKKDKTILSVKQTSKIGSGGTTNSSLKFIMEECSTESAENSNNCTTLSLNSVDESGSGTVKASILGRTDNLGGYVKSTYVDSVNSYDYTIEEAYDSDNNITWLKFTDGNNPPDEYGTLDATFVDDYGYGESYTFESTVNLQISGISGTEDTFVLVLNGEDPNDSEDYIIGVVYYNDTDSSGAPTSDEILITYYGSTEDASNLKVWRIAFNTTTGEFEYVQTSNVVSVQ
jgi:hypothetical protein